MSCFFVFQVYWAGPLSAGVVAALLYNYLLAPRDEPLSEKTQALFCSGSSPENEAEEPLLGTSAATRDAKWPKEPV